LVWIVCEGKGLGRVEVKSAGAFDVCKCEVIAGEENCDGKVSSGGVTII
jgi:hypothetical protein